MFFYICIYINISPPFFSGNHSCLATAGTLDFRAALTHEGASNISRTHARKRHGGNLVNKKTQFLKRATKTSSNPAFLSQVFVDIIHQKMFRLCSKKLINPTYCIKRSKQFSKHSFFFFTISVVYSKELCPRSKTMKGFIFFYLLLLFF